ncbi:hypothetical protein JFQ88_004098 [Aeromonas dhakensis]|nr:hypothetical protein [Aeromonas dhakensis]
MASYKAEYRPQAQKMVDGVIIDPVLRPGFDETPHEERCELEEADWWGVPYIETISFELMFGHLDGVAMEEVRANWFARWPEGNRYDLRCLDGGAWDRSSNRGAFASLQEAIAAAKATSRR